MKQVRFGMVFGGILALLCLTSGVVPESAAAEPLTIRIWMMGFPYEDRTVDGVEYIGIHSLFDEFERRNPGIKVRYENIGWDNAETKIMTSMIGEGPDIYMLGSTWVGQFVVKGTLENLDPYIARFGYPFEKFHKRYLKMGVIFDPRDGKKHTFGLPWVADSRLLAYDKKIFDDYGVEYPHDDMTWEELLEKAKATTGIDPKTGQKTWGYVIKGQDPVFQFMGFLYQNGGEFYNEEETEATFNSREGKEALRFLVDLHRVHNVSGPETMNNWLWNTFGPFLSPKNKYAIYETVPGMIKAGAIDRAGRIGVCTLPKRKRRGGLMGGSFLAINKKSLPEKKEAAFQLIKFLGQPQCQKWLVKQTASLSPRIDLWDWDYLKDHPEWKVGMKQFESSFPTPSAVWGRTYNILGEYIQNALVGDMTPEEALDQAAKEVNRLLEANTAATRRDPAEVKHEISVLNLMFWAVITIMIVFLVIWGWVSHRKRNVRSALIRELKTARPWFVFLSPVLLFLAVFLVYPLLDSLRLSFLAFDGINPLAVMGFNNYTFVLQNAKFWNAVWNTIYLALGGLLIMIPLAVVLAVLINEKVMGKTFFKVVYFMPVITSYVAISIVWQLILNPGETGILNNALSVLGIAPLGWLSDPSLSKPAIIIMDTWRWLGFVTMIMLAGLQGIPESLYEAARIDGAGAVQRFFHVTLPLLKPAITFVVLTHWISALQAFDQIYVLGGVRGGIQRSFQTIVSYLYEVGFVDQHFGVASAIAYILFFIIGVITAINAFWLKPHKGVEER